MTTLCNFSLEDLNKNAGCGGSMSGINTVLYAMKDDIQTFPTKLAEASRTQLADHVNTTTDIVMKTGKRFFKLYSKIDAGELKYTPQGEDGSKGLRANLEIYHPGFKESLLGFLSVILNAEMVLLVKLSNGTWHLLGDADRGVALESGEGTSGKAITDANGANMNFIYDCTSPQIYKGVVDSIQVTDGVAPTIVTNAESVSGTSVTLSGLATVNDGTISKVGFKYRKEGDADWTTVAMPTFTTGVAYTKTITMSAADYSYFAYIIVDGQEKYGTTLNFTVS